MTSTHRQNLLRRTAVAIAALAVSLLALPAAALTVTLKDATGTGNCTYSGLVYDPSGNVTVTCSSTIITSGGGPIDPAGTFNVSVPSTSMQGPATGGAPLVNVTTFTVLRSGGTTGDVSMTYTISGNACWTGAAQMGISAGAASSTPIGLTMIGPGTCTVTISNLTAGVLGTSPSATINVTLPTTGGGGGGGGGTGIVPTVAGCPTPDPSTKMFTMPDPAGPGFNLMVPSGNVASMAINAGSAYLSLSNPPGHLQESLALGESPITYSPTVYTLDMSMSRCPGVLTGTNTADSCNMTGYTQQNGATFTWSNNQAYAQSSLLCYVPDPSTEQWYINIRARYTTCKSASVSVCGWTLSTT